MRYLEKYPLGKNYIDVLKEVKKKIIEHDKVTINLSEDSYIVCKNEYQHKLVFRLVVHYKKINQNGYNQISLFLSVDQGYKPCINIKTTINPINNTDYIFINQENYTKHGSTVYLIFQKLIEHFNLNLS
jgi:hypothetical protein